MLHHEAVQMWTSDVLTRLIHRLPITTRQRNRAIKLIPEHTGGCDTRLRKILNAIKRTDVLTRAFWDALKEDTK